MVVDSRSRQQVPNKVWVVVRSSRAPRYSSTSSQTAYGPIFSSYARVLTFNSRDLRFGGERVGACGPQTLPTSRI